MLLLTVLTAFIKDKFFHSKPNGTQFNSFSVKCTNGWFHYLDVFFCQMDINQYCTSRKGISSSTIRMLIECHTTKNNIFFTLTGQFIATGINCVRNQSELKAKTYNWRQLHVRKCMQASRNIGFGFASHWLRKRHEFLLLINHVQPQSVQ